MNMTFVIVSVFGLFSLTGGIIGFLKAKSRASLIAGAISGFALLICAYGISQGSGWAFFGSAFIAFLLGFRFSRTWLKNRRVMPDLLMVLLSLLTLIAVGMSLAQG